MSRNLGTTSCDECGHPRMNLVGDVHSITPGETGVYFEEYEGLLVADAECPHCHAKYIAWVSEKARVNKLPWPPAMRHAGEDEYFDLSYRSTFNDEPGPNDRGNTLHADVQRALEEEQCPTTKQRSR